MNRNRHRLVFNRRRNQLMAVAENALGRHKTGGETRGPTGRATHTAAGIAGAPDIPVTRLALALAVLLHAAPGQAQIIADPNAPGAHRPTVLTTGNGVPLINIQTPSGAGVSRNVYRQFDIQQPGAILNNAPVQTATQLGGTVPGNPWMTAGGARIILNEVNSSNPSLLGGHLEVAGARAQVIIANPSGITCDGCGFINAGDLTLTTGAPILHGDTLAGYRIADGNITITGEGLRAAGADYTAILARAVSLNAGLWTRRLTVVTGANEVSADAANPTIQASQASAPTTPDQGNTPAFAIDLAQLGGMYANKITLIGTEHGLGVRNAGAIAAIGQIALTTQGKLINTGKLAAGETTPLASQTATAGNNAGETPTQGTMTLTAHAVDNSGALMSAGDLRLASHSDLTNRGRIDAGRELTITTAGQLANHDGALSGQRLNIEAASLGNTQGTLRQTGDQPMHIAANSIANRDGGLIGNLRTAAAETTAEGTTHPLTHPSPDNAGETQASAAPANPLADGRISVRGALANDGGRIIANGRTAVTAADGLSNRNATLDLAELTVGGERLDNTDGKITANTATITARALDNTRGKLTADTLALNARDLSNRGGELIQTGNGDFTVTLAGTLDNAGGKIAGNGENLRLSAGQLINADGQILHAGHGTLALQADTLDGAGGTIQGNGSLTMNATDATLDKASTSAQQIDIAARTLSHKGGALIQTGKAAGRIDATTKLDNTDGALVTAGDLAVQAGELVNTRGIVQSERKLAIAAGGVLDNTDGKLLAAGALEAHAGQTLDNAGAARIAAGGDLDLSAASLNNNASIQSGGNAHLKASQLTQSADGLMTAQGTLTVDAEDIDSHGKLSAQSIAVDAGGRARLAGEHSAAGTLSISAGALNLAGSRNYATGIALTARAGDIDASGATLAAADGFSANTSQTLRLDDASVAAGQLSLNARDLSNRGGELAQTGSGDFTVTLTGTLDNAGGKLLTAGNATLTAGKLNNTGGAIYADKNLTLTTTQTDNNGGRLTAAQGDLTHTQSGNGGGSAGAQEAGGDLRLTSAGSLGFTAADRLSAGKSLALTAGGDIVSAGQWVANGAVSAQAANLTLQSGSRVDGQNIALQANNALTGSGATLAGDHLALRGGRLALTDSALASAGAANLESGSTLALAGSTLTATTDATLSAQGGMDTRGAAVLAGGRLAAHAGAIDNRGGELGAKAGLDITAAVIDNAQGKLLSESNAKVTAKAGLDNTGGTIAANNNLEVDTRDGTLTNTGGTLAAGGKLTADALATPNEGGTLAAGEKLEFNTQDYSGAGALVSGEDLSFQLSGDYTLEAGNLIHANGSLTATLTGHLMNHGTFQAVKDINFTTGAITNEASGKMYAGRTLSLTTGNLTNRGELGAPTVKLSLGNLHNTGIISGTDTASITAEHLENTGPGVIGANDALTIHARQSLNNLDGGTILSNNRLILGEASAPIGRLINSSADITAGRRLELYATTVENKRSIYRPAEVVETGAPTIELVQELDGNRSKWPAHLIGKQFINGTRIRQTVSIETCTPARFGMSETCTTSTGFRFYDKYAAHGSEESMWPRPQDELLKLQTLPPQTVCDQNGENCHRETLTVTAVDILQPHGLDHWPIPEAAGVPTFTIRNWEQGRRYAVVTQRFERRAAPGITAAGKILSGGAMHIQAGAFNNLYSETVAEGALTGAIGALDNVGEKLGAFTRKTTHTGICSDIKGDAPGYLGRCNGAWRWVITPEDTEPAQATMLGGLFGSKTGLDMHIARLDNHTVTADGKTPGGFNLTVDTSGGARRTGASAIGRQTLAGANTGLAPLPDIAAPDTRAFTAPDALTPVPLARAASAIAGLAGIGQAGTNPFTAPTRDPGSDIAPLAQILAAREALFRIPESRLYLTHPEATSPYLVETHPGFAYLSAKVQSSGPILDQLGIATLKRLGDGFYEQRLVADQLRLLTGSAQTDGDANARYRALLEAGKAAAKRFNFTPGISLSAEQVAQLTETIVWMEPRLIDGQAVLVPVVYPARGAASAQRAGATIFGGRYTRITGERIDNRGVIEGQTVQLHASEQLTNLGGTISGRLVDLSAGGDIRTGTHTELVEYAPGQILTRESQPGRIAGETVRLTAGRNLTFLGGELTAGTALLAAGGNLTLRSQEIIAARQLGVGSNNAYQDTEVRHRGNTLTANKDMNLIAGGNLEVTGSRLAAGQNMNLIAGGELTITARRDVTTRQSSGSHGKGGWAQSALYEESLTGAHLQSGKDMNLIAGGDLALLASEAKSGGDAQARAGGEITLGALTAQRSFEASIREKRAAQSRSQASLTPTGSVLAAQGDLTLSSGGATRLTGSALAAGGDLDLNSASDLTLLAAQSHRQEHSARENRKESLSFQMEETRYLLSTITAGGKLELEVGGDLLAHTPAPRPGRADASAERPEAADGRTGAGAAALQANVSGPARINGAADSLASALPENARPGATPGAHNASAEAGALRAASMGAETGTAAPESDAATYAPSLPEADFMTAEGIIRGDARQQVSVRGSEHGQSRVLGDLSAHGIRAGANEAFTPTAAYAGKAALTALLASGQIRGGVSTTGTPAAGHAGAPGQAVPATAVPLSPEFETQTQARIREALRDARINAILAVNDSGPLTVTDEAGRVRLTLAGQAKVEEVYNRLRLTEEYKKHPNAELAQAVTLITAVALTVATQGTAIGAALGQTGSAAVMTNAGAIGLGSTMAGQLAGGAAFDEAFQAGMKAGLVSAAAAGAGHRVGNS